MSSKNTHALSPFACFESLEQRTLFAAADFGLNLHFRNYGQEADGDWTDGQYDFSVFKSDIRSQADLQQYIDTGANVWDEQFLADLSTVGVIRPMEWVPTNDHPISKWENRRQQNEWKQISGPPTNNYEFLVAADQNNDLAALRDTGPAGSYGGASGVAWEWVFDLANRTGNDIWINVPHRATDDYVRNLAQLAESMLNQGQRVFVEYHNEAWFDTSNNSNGAFEWLRDQGQTQTLSNGQTIDQFLANVGIPDKVYTPGGRAIQGFYAHRSAEVWKIFHDEFSNDNRLVNVLSGHVSDQNMLQTWRAVLSSGVGNPGGQDPDTLVRSIYVGNRFVKQQQWLDAGISENYGQWKQLMDDMMFNLFRTDYDDLNGFRELDHPNHPGHGDLWGERSGNFYYAKAQIDAHFDYAGVDPTMSLYEVGIEHPVAKQAWLDIDPTWTEDLFRKLAIETGEVAETVVFYPYSGRQNGNANIPGLKWRTGDPQTTPQWDGFQAGIGNTSDGGDSGGDTSTDNLLQNGAFNGFSGWDAGNNASVAGGGVSGQAGRIGLGNGIFSQTVAAPSSGTISYSAQVKAENGTGGLIGVKFRDASNNVISENSVSYSGSTFQTYSRNNVAIPTGTSSIQFFAWKNATSGYAFVDNASLGSSTSGGGGDTSTDNLLQNGAFNGFSGWDAGNNASVAGGGVSGQAGRIGLGNGIFSQTVAAPSSGTISYSAQVKAENGTGGLIGVKFRDASNNVISENSVSYSGSTFQTYSRNNVAIPTGTVYIQFFVWKDATSGYAFVDNASLVGQL